MNELVPSPIPPQRPARSGRTFGLQVVGFLDTLAAKSLGDSNDFLNAIAFVIEREQRETASWGGRTERRFTTSWFSDNLGVSMTVDDREDTAAVAAACNDVCWFIGDLQSSFLHEFGLLSRGAVTIGDGYHDDHLIFGRALIDATLLEKAAVTPRVVLSEAASHTVDRTVIPLLEAESGEADITPLEALDFIRIGCPPEPTEREAYLHSLEAAVSRGLREAERLLAADESVEHHRIVTKWNWAHAYTTRTARDLSERDPGR